MEMKINELLLQKLRKTWEPSSRVDMKFRGKDIMLKTDEDGNAMVLFIGKALPDGRIKGERFTRVLKKDRDGTIVKDHWDLKGKAD